MAFRYKPELDSTGTPQFGLVATWSVSNGPLTGVSAAGLATVGTAYRGTAATTQGTYLGNTGLTVKNLNLDDLGSYAGDGWQNQNFGLNNPNAAPTFDADSDGAQRSGARLSSPGDHVAFPKRGSKMKGGDRPIPDRQTTWEGWGAGP